MKKLTMIAMSLSISVAASAVEYEGEYSPALSPDGKYVAFHVNSETHAWDIAIRSIETGHDHFITNNDAFDTDPRWSPDGRRLVFSSSMSGNRDIYVHTLATGTTEKIIEHDSMDTHPLWSPDGQSIAFVSRRSGTAQLYLFNLESNHLSELTQQGIALSHPSWTGDGKSIVFDQAGEDGSVIYAVNVHSRAVRLLYDGDGSNIAGKLFGDELFVSTNQNGNWDLLRVNLKTCESAFLQSSPQDEMKADINVAAKLYVYSVAGGDGIFRLKFAELE